jgi:hypothetical protein
VNVESHDFGKVAAGQYTGNTLMVIVSSLFIQWFQLRFSGNFMQYARSGVGAGANVLSKPSPTVNGTVARACSRKYRLKSQFAHQIVPPITDMVEF